MYVWVWEFITYKYTEVAEQKYDGGLAWEATKQLIIWMKRLRVKVKNWGGTPGSATLASVPLKLPYDQF